MMQGNLIGSINGHYYDFVKSWKATLLIYFENHLKPEYLAKLDFYGKRHGIMAFFDENCAVDEENNEKLSKQSLRNEFVEFRKAKVSVFSFQTSS